jgi:hypothetical protein
MLRCGYDGWKASDGYARAARHVVSRGSVECFMLADVLAAYFFVGPKSMLRPERHRFGPFLMPHTALAQSLHTMVW